MASRASFPTSRQIVRMRLSLACSRHYALIPFAARMRLCLDKGRLVGKQRAKLSEQMTIHIRWRTVSGAGLGACLVSLCCAPVFGQSLGDVARQERQRKEQQAPRALHVYTNDDLRKSKILVPEDQARALAAARNRQMPSPLSWRLLRMRLRHCSSCFLLRQATRILKTPRRGNPSRRRAEFLRRSLLIRLDSKLAQLQHA